MDMAKLVQDIRDRHRGKRVFGATFEFSNDDSVRAFRQKTGAFAKTFPNGGSRLIRAEFAPGLEGRIVSAAVDEGGTYCGPCGRI